MVFDPLRCVGEGAFLIMTVSKAAHFLNNFPAPQSLANTCTSCPEYPAIMGNAQNSNNNEALVTECFVDEDEVPSYKCMIAQMTSASSFGSGKGFGGNAD